MAVVVAGGAGFIGSHLVDRLVARAEVVVFDNMFTGRLANLEGALKTERAVLAYVDVSQSAELLDDVLARATSEPVTEIYHFASSDGDSERTRHPWPSLAVHGLGTMQLLKLAERHGATFVLASSAESTFANSSATAQHTAEGKRFAEALAIAARTELGVDARIVRLAECYGPRMSLDNRTLVATLLKAMAKDERPTIQDGTSERRSLTYVADVIDALESIAAVPRDRAPLVDLDSSRIDHVTDIVETFSRVAGLRREAHFVANEEPGGATGPSLAPYPEIAATELGWAPRISLETGFELTCQWFREAAKRYAIV